MDLRQLSYFATIVEEGTITGAARKLHISQPPLSHQMHLLEKELDAVLFIRGARQIKLTEPGITLYRYAMEMLELEQVAKMKSPPSLPEPEEVYDWDWFPLPHRPDCTDAVPDFIR